MPPCHYPLVPVVFSRVQRDASWPKPEVSGTQLYPVIKHFYLTVAKVILCHSHATSLYLNTCYAIYNLQCRIELKSNSLWKRGKIFHERLKNEKNSFIVEKPFYLHLTCSRQGKPVILSCLGIWKNISVKNFERSWASLRIKILIERGCSLLRYFDCSIGSYIDFN